MGLTQIAIPKQTAVTPHENEAIAKIYPDGMHRTIADALAMVRPIPGRMEEVSAGQDFRVMVDYAHTEDRLVKQFACMCGSPNCRRWIRGRREEITQEGRDYLARSQAD